MRTVCLSFEIHQPQHLMPYSFFDAGRSTEFFDTQQTTAALVQDCSSCYIPLIETLDRIYTQSAGGFQCGFIISGSTLSLMRDYCPVFVRKLRKLAEAGCVELVGTPYYHSLVSLTTQSEEFVRQVKLHTELVRELCGVNPTVFCDTELVFDHQAAKLVEQLGFKGMCVGFREAVEHSNVNPNLYHVSGSTLRLVAQHSELNRLIKRTLCCSRMDSIDKEVSVLLESFETKSPDDAVIFLSLRALDFMGDKGFSPVAILLCERFITTLANSQGWRFGSLGEVLTESSRPTVELQDLPQTQEGPWLTNSLQRRAFEELYSAVNSERIPAETWQYLQDVSYLLQMRIGEAENPYDTFINFMNILRGAAHGAPSERQAIGSC